MARKKEEDTPSTSKSKKIQGAGEPAKAKAKKAKASAAKPPAEKAPAKRKPPQPGEDETPRADVVAEPAAVLAAELEVLRAVLTSQQIELENRRSQLEQVEWRERLLSEELDLLRGSQQDIAEVRREAADARGQAADALAQMAEALSQMAAAKGHAEDAERRLQDMIREAQETRGTLASYQDELARLQHELEQAQEWQNDLESELSLRASQAGDEMRELGTLRTENERLETELKQLGEKLRTQETINRKLEKTLTDRAEELAELATLVEEADAREDKLRSDYERELKKLRAEASARDETALEKAREQLQALGTRLAEANERAESSEKQLASANVLLDELEELLEKGQGLERLRMRLHKLRGGGNVLEEVRAKEREAECRAEAAHQEMVSMRTRMLEAHNQLELSEIARRRAEQKVAQLEEQLRASTPGS